MVLLLGVFGEFLREFYIAFFIALPKANYPKAVVILLAPESTWWQGQTQFEHCRGISEGNLLSMAEPISSLLSSG